VLLNLAAACGSFSGEELPAPVPEAGTPDGSAGPDAGAGDVVVGSDAAGDADAAKAFCLSQPSPSLFCADFEDGPSLAAKFATLTGDVTIVGTDVFAGVGALRAVGLPNGSAVAGRTLGEKRLAGQAFSFRVRASETTTDYDVIAARLVVGANPDCHFQIRLRRPAKVLLYMTTSQGGIMTPLDVVGHPGFDTWFNVKLDLRPAGDAGLIGARVKINGVEGLTPNEIVSGCPVGGIDALPRIEIGAQSTGTPVELRFDNVVFDGK
jgi:hypothetical protein